MTVYSFWERIENLTPEERKWWFDESHSEAFWRTFADDDGSLLISDLEGDADIDVMLATMKRFIAECRPKTRWTCQWHETRDIDDARCHASGAAIVTKDKILILDLAEWLRLQEQALDNPVNDVRIARLEKRLADIAALAGGGTPSPATVDAAQMGVQLLLSTLLEMSIKGTMTEDDKARASGLLAALKTKDKERDTT